MHRVNVNYKITLIYTVVVKEYMHEQYSVVESLFWQFLKSTHAHTVFATDQFYHSYMFMCNGIIFYVKFNIFAFQNDFYTQLTEFSQ